MLLFSMNAMSADRETGVVCFSRRERSHRRGKEELEDGPHQSPADCPRRGRGRRHDAYRTISPRPGGTADPSLRADAELKIFDPIWTTAYITRNHGYLVYDTLFGTDENYQIKPQMVDQTNVSADGMKYTFTLRDGLRWHDGQPVVSEDCVESLKRWGKKDRFGQLLMAHTAKIAPVDKKTFTLELAERFSPVLDALGKPSSNVPFMMPARIASTPAEEQIKEIVGSGPFKFAKDEWQPGEQAVYVRNPDYIPRDEPPSGSTGGKRAYLDKVIWRYIAEPWDAANDLAAGEVDWWELPPFDFIPKIEQNPDFQKFVFDPLGTQGWLRPNWLHPPFNNKKARQALLHMMDQVTYLAWAIGPPEYYRPSYSVFASGGPYATMIGAEPMMEHDLSKARRLVQESGYDGQPVVVLHVTDIPYLNAMAIVTRQRLSRSASRSSSKGWIGRRCWWHERARSHPTRAAGTFFIRGGRRRTSLIPPSTSA